MSKYLISKINIKERKLSTLGKGCLISAHMLLLLTVQKGARFSAEGCVGEEVTLWPVLVPAYGRSGVVAAMGYQKLLQKRFRE